MAKVKKWSIWIGVIAVIAGGIFWYVKSKKPTTTYTTAVAEKGNLAQTVSVTGDLVANDEITLNFEIGGKVNKLFKKVGDQIASGDVIATLTDNDLQKQLEQSSAALDQAIANSDTNNDNVRERKVNLENAESTLDDTEDLNDENISVAKQSVDNAQAYLDSVEKYYNTVVSNPLTGPSTVEGRLVWLNMTTAQNNLDLAKKSKDAEQARADLAKTVALNNVETAKASLKTAQSNYAEQSRDASVAQARAGYELALLNRNKATLISPVNGTITELNNDPGEVLGTGVIKESFSRVMSLDMIVQSKVPESDVVKVKLGQHAKVTFDALTLEDIFDAEVIEIDPASTNVQGVVYYNIKLKLNTMDLRVKPGMSLNIDIATAEKNDVIMVPSRAIKTEGSKKFVDVLKADGISTDKVFVETGLEGDEGMVEVKSGLKGGEKVVTFVTVK